MPPASTSAARYAIYLAPPADSPLWRFGSEVLGYDAASGEEIEGFAPDGFTPEQWRSVAERPRLYGFHATLKAPFRLAPDQTFEGLSRELMSFCASRRPFDLDPLEIASVGDEGGEGFVAFTPPAPPPELAALEIDVVSHFDRFRAPLTADEVAKRRPHLLTTRQRESLHRFGYPHVGPDYHLHMTLTGGLRDAPSVAESLKARLAERMDSVALRIDSCLIFGQESPSKRFRILLRAPFAG